MKNLSEIDLPVTERTELKVAEIIGDIGARMIADPVEERFESRADVEILAGMQFETDIDTFSIEHVENWVSSVGPIRRMRLRSA